MGLERGKEWKSGKKRKGKLLCRHGESLVNPKKSLYFFLKSILIFVERLALGLHLSHPPVNFLKLTFHVPVNSPHRISRLSVRLKSDDTSQPYCWLLTACSTAWLAQVLMSASGALWKSERGPWDFLDLSDISSVLPLTSPSLIYLLYLDGSLVDRDPFVFFFSRLHGDFLLQRTKISTVAGNAGLVARRIVP